VWSGCTWLRIGIAGGLLWTRWWSVGFWRHRVSHSASYRETMGQNTLSLGQGRPLFLIFTADVQPGLSCWIYKRIRVLTYNLSKSGCPLLEHGGCIITTAASWTPLGIERFPITKINQLTLFRKITYLFRESYETNKHAPWKKYRVTGYWSWR
jgi:hypothetical protein